MSRTLTTVSLCLCLGLVPAAILAAEMKIVADLLMEQLCTLDKRFTRKPHTQWKRSGGAVWLHPLASDVTHDTPGPAVLGPALARLPDGAVLSVYSTLPDAK